MKRRDDTMIAEQAEMLNAMAQEIITMADDVISVAITQDKGLIRTYYNVLIGACRIYAIAAGIDTACLPLARSEIESSCKRQGLDPEKIIKYLW